MIYVKFLSKFAATISWDRCRHFVFGISFTTDGLGTNMAIHFWPCMFELTLRSELNNNFRFLNVFYTLADNYDCAIYFRPARQQVGFTIHDKTTTLYFSGFLIDIHDGLIGTLQRRFSR